MGFKFLIICVIMHLANCQELPLCQKCSCKSNSVTCSDSDVKQYIAEPDYWNNNGNMYPYVNITINDDKSLTTLDVQFPESNLNVLNLEYNGIRNITDGAFQNLQNMTKLVLSHNLIDLLSQDTFKGKFLEGDNYPLESLKTLLLEDNKIHSLHHDVFAHADRVEVLSLSKNPLKVLDMHTVAAITSLTQLKELDLSYTEISILPDTFLHTPKFLEFLNLAGNKFEGIPKTLGDSYSLTTLIMNENPIVNLTDKNGFPKVPSLKVLHMCQMNNLTCIGRHSLYGLEKLEKLFIAGNDRLVHLDDNALCDPIDGAEYTLCPLIKELRINDNKLSRLNQPFIGRWDKLEYLDMKDNPWTCECENQWFLDELMPIYLQINNDSAKQMKCAAPIEMEDYIFFELFEKKESMRCLDKYGNRPERDAALLVGILAGLLIAIPLALFIVYSYQRRWFGLFDNSAAAYSRRFYRRTTSDDYFY